MTEKKKGGCCGLITSIGCFFMILSLAVSCASGYFLWKNGRALTAPAEWTLAVENPVLAARFNDRVDEALLQALTREGHRFTISAPVEEFNAFLAETFSAMARSSGQKLAMEARIESSGKLAILLRIKGISVVMRAGVSATKGEIKAAEAELHVGQKSFGKRISSVFTEEFLNGFLKKMPFTVEEFATDGVNVTVSGRVKDEILFRQ